MIKKSFLKKTVSFLLACSVVLSMMAMCAFSSSAAFSGGSGTKKDPYLVKTADDLYNMRNDLSAYYKLAATIDMSGYSTNSKFFKNGVVPIGDDSTKPFTGTFTCDLGSDGLPLYAILNLNIYNAKGELFNHEFLGESDYPDAMGQPAPYFYETALFGNTDGAYIANIYLINATVYSSIVGQMDGRYTSSDEGSKISYKAFLDYQATATLIGRANNTTVNHCAATGSVKGKSSQHGGLIGYAAGSNISSSYVDVDVDTGGCWHVGTFIGHMTDSTSISKCYAMGKLNAGLDGYGKMKESFAMKYGEGAGGFAGQVDSSVIEDCYSNVALSSSTRGNNFYGMASGNYSISNCYTYGAYDGKSSLPSGNKNTTNCYISNATYGLQADFNAASPADITTYFTARKDWKAGTDGYPVLSTVNIVTDKSIYVPGGERETTVVETPVVDNEGTNSETETETETEDPSSSENSSEETVTNIQGGATDEKTDTMQIVLMVFLLVMISGISVLTVFLIYKAISYNPVGNNKQDFSEEEDDIDE